MITENVLVLVNRSILYKGMCSKNVLVLSYFFHSLLFFRGEGAEGELM